MYGMPVIYDIAYNPPHIFKNGHINTIIPFLFRTSVNTGFSRVREETPDGDFIDVDTISNGSNSLAVFCHGLEGNSRSRYMTNIARLFSEYGFDVVSWNYRGCSGEPNLKKRFYHSGATEDLDFIINTFGKNYSDITLVGFSLGGNLLLKYLGDGIFTIPLNVKCAVAISAPVDLYSASERLHSKDCYFYAKRFLYLLKQKVKAKHRLRPDEIDTEPLRRIKTLRDFDNYYTAPIHGFKDAEDYWKQCSSLPYLKKIDIPTLILNAADDPILGKKCYPKHEANINSKLTLLLPRYGGHVGFYTPDSHYTWAEKQALSFVSNYIDTKGKNKDNDFSLG